jgi:hypothetical protein
VFHSFLLRVHVPNDDRLFPGRLESQVADFTDGATSEWAADRILSHVGQGRDSILQVQWRAGDTSWVEYKRIKEIPAMLEYLEAQGAASIASLRSGTGKPPFNDPQVFASDGDGLEDAALEVNSLRVSALTLGSPFSTPPVSPSSPRDMARAKKGNKKDVDAHLKIPLPESDSELDGEGDVDEEMGEIAPPPAPLPAPPPVAAPVLEERIGSFSLQGDKPGDYVATYSAELATRNQGEETLELDDSGIFRLAITGFALTFASTPAIALSTIFLDNTEKLAHYNLIAFNLNGFSIDLLVDGCALPTVEADTVDVPSGKGSLLLALFPEYYAAVTDGSHTEALSALNIDDLVDGYDTDRARVRADELHVMREKAAQAAADEELARKADAERRAAAAQRRDNLRLAAQANSRAKALKLTEDKKAADAAIVAEIVSKAERDRAAASAGGDLPPADPPKPDATPPVKVRPSAEFLAPGTFFNEEDGYVYVEGYGDAPYEVKLARNACFK